MSWRMQAEGGAFKAAGPAQQLALLYIHNALLLRLSVTLGSRKLPELRLHLIAAECPKLRWSSNRLCLLLLSHPWNRVDPYMDSSVT